MRKRLITPIPQDDLAPDAGGLDLDGAAVVEVTSEEKDYPVESALVSGEIRGGRATA
jgi:hypothetical protein